MIATSQPIPASPTNTALCGDVVCRRVDCVSTLTRLYSRAPLKLLSPTKVGRAAHVVMSSFGGGMVAGDDVPIRICVDERAACVVSTQASSKVYRSDGRACMQAIDATIDDDAVLVMLPDPLTCYAGASYQQRQRYSLASRGNLVALDWITSGRWAREERWQFQSLESRTDVRVAGEIVLRETLKLSDLHDATMRVGRFDCYAVLTMVGPHVATMAARAAAVAREWPVGRRPDLLAGAAELAGGAIVRILGPRVQVVQERLKQLLEPLTEVIGADPWARKW